jgi:hypothetical protein
MKALALAVALSCIAGSAAAQIRPGPNLTPSGRTFTSGATHILESSLSLT